MVEEVVVVIDCCCGGGCVRSAVFCGVVVVKGKREERTEGVMEPIDPAPGGLAFLFFAVVRVAFLQIRL